MLGLNYLLIAVVEIKPRANITPHCPAPETDPELCRISADLRPPPSASSHVPAHHRRSSDAASLSVTMNQQQVGHQSDGGLSKPAVTGH